MSHFSADWLSLREPADAASRSAGLGAALSNHLRQVSPANGVIRVVDLGAGTAANLRYLAPRIGGPQEWLLVDGDSSLLDAVPERIQEWAELYGVHVVENEGSLTLQGSIFECGVRLVFSDLAKETDWLDLARGSLVSASALLDLVSSVWLAALADRCVKADATVYFALTYDGRIECQPPDPQDAEVRELVNTHQRTDKGFGPALGPDAASIARRIFEGRGYHLVCAPSDWRIGNDHAALQRALVDGWFHAACEVAPDREPVLQLWRDRRLARVGAGESELIVGHVDMIGWPLAPVSC